MNAHPRQQPGPETPHRAALAFAQLGWEVFPVNPATKRSHKAEAHSGTKWGKTTDPAVINADFDKWPDANVGIATGPDSGIFVVDVDAKHNGLANWQKIAAEVGPITPTVTAHTPTGGRHYYFRWPVGEPITNSVGKLAPGVDIRGRDGIVVAPPSVRADVGSYDFAPGCGPWELTVAEAPAALLEALRRLKETPAKERRDSQIADRIADEYAAAIAEVRGAAEGNRNDTLNRAGFVVGQMIGGGLVEEADARSALTEAALTIGLNDAEVRATLEGAIAKGKEKPRRRADLERDLVAGSLSDDQLALDLMRTGFKDDALHVEKFGLWLVWQGTHWEQDHTSIAEGKVRGFLRHRAEMLVKWAATTGDDKLAKWAGAQADHLRSLAKLRAVEILARMDCAEKHDAFDPDTFLLGTPSGTVELRTGALRPARRDDRITQQTKVAPAADAECPQWLRFLDQACGGDGEIVAFLQRLAGYALTGSTKEQKLFHLYGKGGNGKSVFTEVLLSLMGSYATTADSSIITQTYGEQHPTSIAALRGRRLVVTSEVAPGKRWNEERVKNLTGGDRLVARFMRQDDFEFDSQLTLIVRGNHKPSFSGVDAGMRRRLVLVPFTQDFSDRPDPDLKDRLLAEEAPGILRWAIEGAADWANGGLRIPDSILKESAAYLDDEDTVGRFLADECVRQGDAFVAWADLYPRFEYWCEGEGIAPQHRLKKHSLGKDLEKRDLAPAKSNGVRGIRGLALRTIGKAYATGKGAFDGEGA